MTMPWKCKCSDSWVRRSQPSEPGDDPSRSDEETGKDPAEWNAFKTVRERAIFAVIICIGAVGWATLRLRRADRGQSGWNGTQLTQQPKRIEDLPLLHDLPVPDAKEHGPPARGHNETVRGRRVVRPARQRGQSQALTPPGAARSVCGCSYQCSPTGCTGSCCQPQMSNQPF